MSMPNPCPICGETIIHRTDEIGPHSRGSYHFCSRCGVQGPQRRGYDAALEGWNQLALSAAVTALVPDATPAPTLLDWQMLSQWLKAQWQDNRKTYGLTLHTGIFEGHAACARILADLPMEMSAERKLAALHTFLCETLMRTESPEEEQD